MDNPSEVNRRRRNLVIGTAAAGGVAGVTAAVPFVESMEPSERAKALGAPVEVDISALAPGDMLTVEWQGKPVFVLRRTADAIASIAKSDELVADPGVQQPQQPSTLAGNKLRSEKPDLFVAVGVCTHLGCTPLYQADQERFYCPCHGSKYDLAGRVYKGVPAPLDLVVPDYVYLSDSKILIGTDKKEA
jgi:ubiquinol-cytochrome c reductase iron-sulfur subunit